MKNELWSTGSAVACCTTMAWTLLMPWQSQWLHMVLKCVTGNVCKGTKAFALEKVILTTTTSMSQFRLTCFLNLVLEFTNTGWIKKELYWVYVAAKVMPAALMAISGGPSWPKVKAAGQPILLEVSWGEGNWDLGMECMVTVMSPPQPLDQTPERRLSVWALKTDPKFSHLFKVFFQN